jgi:hypothetical protein
VEHAHLQPVGYVAVDLGDEIDAVIEDVDGLLRLQRRLAQEQRSALQVRSEGRGNCAGDLTSRFKYSVCCTSLLAMISGLSKHRVEYGEVNKCGLTVGQLGSAL